MFKKLISMATAALLLATGLSAIAAAPASAAPITSFVVGCLTGPRVGQATSSVNCSNATMNYEWSVTNPIWNPSVSGTFQANQVYQVTYQLVPNSTLGFTVPTLSANAFSVNTTYTGSPTGTTVTSLASTAGDSSMTITITFPDTGSGAPPTTTTNRSAITLPAPTANGMADVMVTGGVQQGQLDQWVQQGMISWSPSVSTRYAAGTAYTATFTLIPSTGYNFTGLSSSFFTISGASSVTITYNGTPRTSATVVAVFPATSGGSSSSSSSSTQTAEQIAAAAVAAAKAAAEAAAAVRAAEVATAQAKLATVLKGDKAGSIDEYKAANISISTAASLARINAEVLKLSANDRADFTKIKAIADKIEFDESFFNATARPTVATYSQYGLTVTDRTVATINAKVLELPVAKRTDVTAIAEIAKVETFVDRVANPATRLSVPAATLVSKGLLPADSPYKYSVVQGLAMYPEGSLNTLAKIEAAIKEQVAKAEAPKLRTAAIKAKIAARKK